MNSWPIFDLSLSTFTFGGDALGRLPDGRAVFVPFALPGERVRVRLVQEMRRYARAELLEVLTPSPERIEPRCLHFGECGGCHYQHMPYEAQLAAKTEILRDQLVRIGKMADPPVRPAVPSPQPWNYRNHVQFHLTPEGQLGYFRAASEDVFPIRECHLPEETLNTVWPQLDFEALPELERIGLRLGIDDDIQLTLESQEERAPELSVIDLPISVTHLSPAGTLVLAGSEYVIIEVLNRPFRISSGSFFQINTRMAAAMVEHILDILPLPPETTALDVYCGVGLFSAFLAPRVGRLISIEASPIACEDFMVNLDEFNNVELYEAPAEDVLPHLDLHPELILVDPPRTGLDRRTMDGILAMGPDHLAYVSCDPATLARDALRLRQGGFRATQITPFDMFPQTYHIESISFWEREKN